MENPSLQIGDNNWAVKDGSILGYNIIQDNYLPQPITFTRATAATRVNAEGLIENAFVLGAELVTNGDFADGSANWGNYINGSSTIVFTDVATLNIDASNSNVGIYQENVFTSGKQYKIVLKMKASSSFDAEILETQQASTISTIGSVSLTTSYQNFTFYFTATGSNDIFIHRKFSAASANQSITIDNVSVKEVITNNIPRIDYTGGGFGKLLLEPQRTNLITQSEYYGGSEWTKASVSITSNSIISPDGTLSGSLMTITGGVSDQRIYTNITYSGTNVVSIFAKASDSKWLSIRIGNNTNKWYDLENGILGGSTLTGGYVDADIQDYGNGWYRCILVFTDNFNTSTRFYPAEGNLDITHTSGSVYIYGAQAEASSSYATSYIPTSGVAVTRVADTASKTGISSLIGQTEGTLFAEVEILNNALGWILDASDGTTTNRTLFFKLNNNQIRFLRNSTTQSSSTSLDSPILSLGVHKIALAYQSGNTAFFIDGVQISTTNTATFTNGTLNKISLGTAGDGSGNQLGDRISQALLFKTRLTNAELATLTTL
jgi:hypothetical protein